MTGLPVTARKRRPASLSSGRLPAALRPLSVRGVLRPFPAVFPRAAPHPVQSGVCGQRAETGQCKRLLIDGKKAGAARPAQGEGKPRSAALPRLSAVPYRTALPPVQVDCRFTR